MYRFPKQHWKNVRTTNVIERSTGISPAGERRARCRAKTPRSCCSTAWSPRGQIRLRKIDGTEAGGSHQRTDEARGLMVRRSCYGD